MGYIASLKILRWTKLIYLVIAYLRQKEEFSKIWRLKVVGLWVKEMEAQKTFFIKL